MIEGNDPMVPLFRSAVKALENVAIRATTDRAGKPVHVDNLDEAKAAMRNMLGKFHRHPSRTSRKWPPSSPRW